MPARQCPAGTRAHRLRDPDRDPGDARRGGAVRRARDGARLRATAAARIDGRADLVRVFFGIAFACFWGVWGPDANPGPGGKLGGLIVGFLFVPMGIGGALLFWCMGPVMGERVEGDRDRGWRAVEDDPRGAIRRLRDAHGQDRRCERLPGRGRAATSAPSSSASTPCARRARSPTPSTSSSRSAPSIGFELPAMSPVSAITHVLAIVAGVWGGLWVIGRVTPDLPQDNTEPGVEATGDVDGGDPRLAAAHGAVRDRARPALRPDRGRGRDRLAAAGARDTRRPERQRGDRPRA